MGGRRPAVFDRIEQAPNLTAGLIDTLVSQIESGELAPGQRLPTEQAIVTATGVSRTVVREALASLRARGLITTRQGLGAFVAESATPRSFSIDSKAGLADALRIYELRLGIEAEAASLAAVRRTEEDSVAAASGIGRDLRCDPCQPFGCRGGFHLSPHHAARRRQPLFQPGLRRGRQRDHPPAAPSPRRDERPGARVVHAPAPRRTRVDRDRHRAGRRLRRAPCRAISSPEVLRAPPEAWVVRRFARGWSRGTLWFCGMLRFAAPNRLSLGSARRSQPCRAQVWENEASRSSRKWKDP